MTPLLFILTIILILMAASSVIIFIVGPSLVLHPKRHDEEYFEQKSVPLVPSDLEMNYIEVKITVEENVSLHGWFIPSKEKSRGTIIYMHGVGSSKIVGLPFVKSLHENRFNVLMYDSRAHGKSGGRFCTYGFYEKFDLQKAINLVETILGKKIKKIGVYGNSMGGAIALQGATVEPRICALVVEGCFTNLRTITVDYQTRITKMPWHYLRNIAMKRSEAKAKFSHHDVSPLRAIKRVTVPILLVHGTKDNFCKPQYSKTLFDAATSPKELFFVEGAGHHNLRKFGGESYALKISKFFAKNLK